MIDILDHSLEQCPSTYFDSLAPVSANNFCYVDEGQYLHEEFHQVIAQLSLEQPALSFDLRLSADDKNLLNQLHIYTEQKYNNFGDLQNLSSGLKLFIESLAPENDKISNPITELIVKLVNNVVLDESAVVSARASVGTSQFDFHDWHTDPCIAQILDHTSDDRGCKKNEHIAVFSLKGPSTLFSLLPAEKRAVSLLELAERSEEFNLKANVRNYFGNETHAPLISIDSTDNYVDYELLKRQELEKMIDTFGTFSGNFGQEYAFLTGTYGAVHAVPPIHEERLFIAVSSANQEEIKKIKLLSESSL